MDERQRVLAKFTGDVLRFTTRIEVVNPQNLNTVKQHLAYGSALVFSNHFAKLDPIAYGKMVGDYLTTLDNVTVMASRKHFDPQRGKLNRIQNYIGEGWEQDYGIDIVKVVQRYDKDNYPDWESFNRQALKRVIEAARIPGRVIYVAPEGTRSRTNQLLEAENGLGAIFRMGKNMLALPIAAQYGHVRPLMDKTIINVGVPFRIEEIVDPSEKRPEVITDLMMRRLANLLPEQHRGYYAAKAAS